MSFFGAGASEDLIPRLFNAEGHLTDAGMLELAKTPGHYSYGEQDRHAAHVAKCEPCRQRWNEYYIEWCS